MHIVLILKGKGGSKADSVSFRAFHTIAEAEEFVNSATDFEGKYWTVATLADERFEYETYRDWHK